MSALDELARYLGDPDRPFDARALELVSQAIAERNGDLPGVGHLGDDLDLPFADAGPSTTADLSRAVITGGMVVSAAVIPLPIVGVRPALVFNFHRYDGHLLRPVVLVTEHEQMHKAAALVSHATAAACQAARR